MIFNFALNQFKSGSRKLNPYFLISTASISHKCYGVLKHERKKGRFFRTGDWDRVIKPIAEVQKSDPRYLFYKEHLFDNVPIKQTTAYAYHRERQLAGRPRRGFETKEAVLVRLQGYVQIFRSIEHAGKITPGYELMGRRGDEIGCILGRNGEVLKLANGNNRFAIASILELPVVPVQIYFMHANLLGDVRSSPGIMPGHKINRFLLDRIGAKP